MNKRTQLVTMLSLATIGVGASVSGRDAHFDRPLSQFAVQGFANAQSAGYIGGLIMPRVNVGKQSDKYYTIDKADWLRLHDTKRSPRTRANRVEWSVSSNAYFADNYALADEIAIEDINNADDVLQLRQGSVEFLNEGLLRDYERRVANAVMSGSNVGSFVNVQSLSGTTANQWTAVKSADILAQVTSGSSFIRSITGMRPNTMVLDYDSYQLMKRNERLFTWFQNVSGGLLTDEQLKELFGVSNIWVGNAIFNSADPNVDDDAKNFTATDIWPDACLLAYVNPAVRSQRIATLGLSFNWRSDAGTNMQVTRSVQNEAGSKHIEVIESGYYQDEKVIAPELGYLITNTR